MKYKTKIIPKDNGYIGCVLQNDELIFSSDFCKDEILATRAISNFIRNSQTQTNGVRQVSSFQKPNLSVSSPVNLYSKNAFVSDSSKCCGRG